MLVCLRKNRLIVLFYLLVLLCFSAVAESKEQDLFTMSIEELMNIKVSVASNVTDDPNRLPVSVTVINRNDIRQSGARTLNELLSIYVPGYFLVEDQDDTIAAYRGVVPDNNSKVMLLLNGQSLNADWFWGPPDAVLNGIDMGFIERIEVIRGPGSVTLGGGALLGVINIITHVDSSQPAQAAVEYGSDGLRKVRLRAQYQAKYGLYSFYAANGRYEGTSMASRGWTAARIDQGLSVAQRNHNLHRSEYQNLLASATFSDVDLDVFRFKQKRDLYNFFRDREVVEQRISGIKGDYHHQLAEELKLSASFSWQQDDYALFSHGGNLQTTSRYDFESTVSGFSAFTTSQNLLADAIVTPDLTMGGG